MVEWTALLCIFGFLLLIAITVVIGVVIYQKHEDARFDKEQAQERELELKRIQVDYNIKVLEIEASKPKPVEVKDPEKKKPDKASENDIAAWYDLLADPFSLFEGTKDNKQGGEQQ